MKHDATKLNAHTEENNMTVPRGWSCKKLSELVNPRAEKVSPKKFPTYSFLGMDHIEAHTTKIIGSSPAIGMKSNASRFYNGDVIYGRLRPYLNKVTVTYFDGLASGEFIVFPGNSSILNEFLKYRLNCIDFVSFASHLNEGDRPRVNFDQIGEFPVLLPPLPEQHRIVAKIEELFSELDKGIENLKTAREQLKVYRQSVLKYAFEGKLPSENLEDALLADWKQMRFEDITVGKEGLRRGPFGSAIKKAFFVPKGYKVYEQQNAIYDDPTLGEYYISKEKYEELKSFQIKPKDFIVSCSGTIGRIAQLPNDAPPGVINQALLRIRLRDNIVKEKFFLHLFRSEFFQRKILVETRGSAMKNVTGVDNLKEIPLLIPPIPEQDKIIEDIEARLSVVEQMEQTIEDSLQKAEALRQSILKKAFEGKLVPQDPKDEPASVLLERIKAEKAKHGKNTVRKKKTGK